MFESYKSAHVIAKALLTKDGTKNNHIKFLAHILAFFALIGLAINKVKNYIIINRYKKKELIEKYEGIALADKSYGPRNESKYFVKEFIDFDDLKYVLGEVNDHEADLTKEGFNFLEEYYGINNLAEELYKGDWYQQEYNSTQKILEWFEHLRNKAD